MKALLTAAVLTAATSCAPAFATSDAFCLGVAKMAEYTQAKRLVGFTDAQTAADLGYRGNDSTADDVVFTVVRFVYDHTAPAATPADVGKYALVRCRVMYTQEDRT